MEEAWQSVKANNPKYTLNRLDEAAQYVSHIGIENHMLRAQITAGIGDPAEAVRIATDGLALSYELLNNGQPLMATKKIESADQKYFDNFILSGLYFARGQAYNKLRKHALAISDLEKALELEVADGMREKLEPDSRFHMEAKILTQLALAEMLKTRNKRLICKIYVRADYLNSTLREPVESYGLKEICDDFFADKSLMPKFHKREGMDFFSKALCSELSIFDTNGQLKSGKDWDAARIRRSRTPLEHVDFFVNYMKNDPTLYSSFKSDESLLAWSMSVVYNSSRICPGTFIPHLTPPEGFDWNKHWNQYMPRR